MDRLGSEYGAIHDGLTLLGHQKIKGHGYEANDWMQSPPSVTGPRNGYMCEFSNFTMEGATKWNPICLETSDKVQQVCGHSKHLIQPVHAISTISALEVELEQAQESIYELETEKRSSKKKLEHFLKKLSEERAAWRSKEHEKIRAIMADVKSDLKNERKNQQRLEIVNSKLVKELADTKLLAKRYMLEYEKERKARELTEEVCNELAKEIGEDKAEVEALKRESMKMREEVEEERKMLQMAEVWREERVQMKLIDAKVMIEEKYSYMNKVVADMEAFLSSRSSTSDVEMRKAEFFQQAAASLNVQDIKEFTYEPPNPDDIFSVFEDINFGKAEERDIGPCIDVFEKDNKHIHANTLIHQNGEIDDESGWETVSHVEDQVSSYSPEGSDPSVNKNFGKNNGSSSGTEWEENGCEETPISEVCSAPKTHLKKVSSIARLWRSGSNNGENFKTISVDGMNGRLSTGAIVSPDRSLCKGRHSPSDLTGQWSSPDLGNPHITRGMKGCIEWPHVMQKSSLKASLLEARVDSQKIQLKEVLKQKI